MAQPFKWDEEDVMASGFEQEPEPEPVPAPRPPPKGLPKPSKMPVPKPKLNTAAVLDELETSPDPAELTEAEWRLEKAGFYRAVINSQLLSSDHPAAVEVEQELQEWAKIQLETLLGIRRDPRPDPGNPTEISQFTDEEASILKALAAKALSRQASPQPTTTPAPVPAKPLQPIQPVAAKPQARVTPVASAEERSSRGRGRPRKNPCRICGKMECEHKRQGPNDPKPSLKNVAMPIGETFDGVPIQVLPDGTKFIDTADGRRYKLQVRKVTHKETGEVRDAYVPVELAKKMDDAPGQKPFPSEAEIAMLAAQEAAVNTQRVASLTAVSNTTGQKITGNDLIKAAMEAPEKEEYIPTPPSRR